MKSNQGKLFIGRIFGSTSEETLKKHFEKYGEDLEAVIVLDKITLRPREFGFVVFADPSVLDRLVVRRDLSREERPISSRSGNPKAGGNTNPKKIFVGGLPRTLTEEEFRHYYEAFGPVNDVIIVYERIYRVLHKRFHELNDQIVEIKLWRSSVLFKAAMAAEIIRVIVLPAPIQVDMKVEWIPIGTGSLRLLGVVFRHMVMLYLDIGILYQLVVYLVTAYAHGAIKFLPAMAQTWAIGMQLLVMVEMAGLMLIEAAMVPVEGMLVVGAGEVEQQGTGSG
ncbi:hypothetical protein HHK36_022485 [Tetracentron sinense]|uniref:RRM domain-containing protein n=1 Tax=Tetracentron sinense TaxID=13715 RepID=A0A835D6C7_TETSI|nr:hypothetical protein HHK36_022485 [Tetracentron sinense]